MQTRQQRLMIASTAGVLLTGVILVLGNILFNWVYLRLDLTRGNAYSLSKSSKTLVRGLDDPLVIKAYFTPDLPPPYNTFGRYVKDILSEYRAAARGKVRFEFVPHKPPQEFEQKAMEAGLSPIQFEEMGSDKLQIRRGFMGLVMFYRDKSETLPVIKGPETLEFDLTSRIAKMARKDKKRIVATQGHGEFALEGSQSRLAQDLSVFYDLDSVNLQPATTGPITADALLVAGPQQRFDDKALWAIDQALMRGTPVAFLVDSKRLLVQQFMMMPQSTGLEALLATYGVKLTDQLVYDAQCESVGMTQSIGGMALTTSIRYPYVPMVTQLEKDHPILRGVDAVGLPFPWRVDPGTLPEGVKFTPLLFSSARSWTAPPETYSVAPNAIPQPKRDEPRGPYVLAGVLQGSFPSHFAGKPAPIQGGEVIAKSPPTTIFVVGTSQLLNPSLPEFRGVDALVSNALAYLSKDETVIGIQSKWNIIRPLKPVPGPVREILKYAVTLGVPLLAVFWGLVRWRRRQAWRATVAAGFTHVQPPA